MPVKFPLDLDILQRVLDYVNEGVYITDRDRRILLWNRKAEEMTGYARERVVGLRCRDQVLNHLDKEGRPLCSTELCPLYRAMATDSASLPAVVIYAHTATRGLIPVSVSVAPLHGENGEVIGGIEVFRDESQRLRDLEFARRIQQATVTTNLPTFRTLEFAVRLYTHELVGGDYYEVREIAPETAGILVADVRGHGVSGALYTMVLRSISDDSRALALQPAGFLAHANRSLAKISLAEVFATAVYMVLEGETGTIRVANAGHPPPLLIAPTGQPTELQAGNMPLGFDQDEVYEEKGARLETDQVLLAFTDGAIEIENRDGKKLGSSGLARLAGGLDMTQGQRALDQLHDALLGYCASVQFPDDLLLLSCRRRKPGG